jgi:hypothetical protein
MQIKISLFLIAFLTICACGRTQNTISIAPTSSTFTALSTPVSLTTRQTKSSAFSLTITPKNNPCLVNVTGSTTSPIPISKLVLKLNTVTTGSGNLNSSNVNEIPLSSTAVQILNTQKKNANIVASYNLYLDPIGWSIPGNANYSFTVTITLSPQ